MTKKLLLADDSITIQKVIGIIFATEDYQLLVTDNGDDAFAKALEEHPDLVVADISMPGKDGFELCQAIKSDPQLAHTSVMLLPGTFDHFDEERAQQVGADGWLTKPFESQALLDKVTQLIEAEPVRLAADAAPQTEESLSVDDSVVELDGLAVDFEAPAEDEFSSVEFVSPVEETTEPAGETTEPVGETTEPVGETTEPVGEDASAVFVPPVVDEVVLGLDEVDELAPAREEMAEESPDDIWDAVSFDDEELQESTEKVAEDSFSDESPMELLSEEVASEPEAQPSADSEMASLTDESVYVVPAGVVDEPLESATDDLPIDDFAAVDEADEFEPLALEETEIEATADPEPEVAGVTSVEEEPTVFAAEDDLIEGSAGDLPLVEPLDEDALDEDEEILDLADEDILEEQSTADVELVAEEAVEPEAVLETEAEEVISPVFEAQDDPEPEMLAEVTGLPGEDEIAVDETTLSADVEEDDGFYFDASATEEEVAAEVEVAPLAAAAATATAETTVAAVTSDAEQVEQQLRQLTDEELQTVVAKVAGPIIERIAGEMLERLAWEVVPDLAESLIREEIRKIKQPVE